MKFTLLNLILIVAVAAFALALITQRNKQLEVSTDYGFSWSIRQRVLTASPVWNAERQNPPLSVREALQIADEIASNLNTGTKQFQVGNWTFDSLNLVPLDNNLYSENRSRWCYLVPFQGTFLGGHSGPPFMMSMIILMDGTVLVGETRIEPKMDEAMKKVYPDSKR